MDRRINWLHFSDLHYGQRSQDVLLPKIKKELLKDIEIIKNEIGKIDVVFFTGDLTQTGKKEEFDQLNVFLNELWEHLGKLNSSPVLLAIPGNHDLLRPDTTRAAVKVLRNFHNDIEFQESFWREVSSKGEYYDVLNQCFGNFCKWYADSPFPKPDLSYGLLPGDISATMWINNIQLKVIGLNTAFLELTGDDYRGKLAIHPLQIQALTSSDPLNWAEDADLALLLTHHDPMWYNESSKAYYNNDINPNGTFYNHLCGHLHEPNSYEYGLIGSAHRRIQLAPSMFGLQTINNTVDRIHGYYAGSYTIDDSSIVENFYPRKTHKKYNGNLTINADFGFDLTSKHFVELIRPRKTGTQSESKEILNVHQIQQNNDLIDNDLKEDNIFEPTDNKIDQKELVSRQSKIVG